MSASDISKDKPDDRKAKKINHALALINELVKTEETFCNNMDIATYLFNKYYRNYSALNLHDQENANILSAFKATHAVSEAFLKELKQLRAGIPNSPTMEDLTHFSRQYEGLYARHIHAYSSAIGKASLLNNPKIMDALKAFEATQYQYVENDKGRPQPTEALLKMQHDTQYPAGWVPQQGWTPQLSSYLIQPVQRLPRHVLLAEQLTKHIESAPTTLISLADFGSKRADKMPETDIILYPTAEETVARVIAAHFKLLFKEMDDHTKFNSDPKTYDIVKKAIEVLDNSDTPQVSLVAKLESIKTILMTCEKATTAIKLKITEKQPGYLKKTLIKMGLKTLEQYQAHRQEKYKSLLSRCDQIDFFHQQLSKPSRKILRLVEDPPSKKNIYSKRDEMNILEMGRNLDAFLTALKDSKDQQQKLGLKTNLQNRLNQNILKLENYIKTSTSDKHARLTKPFLQDIAQECLGVIQAIEHLPEFDTISLVPLEKDSKTSLLAQHYFKLKDNYSKIFSTPPEPKQAGLKTIHVRPKKPH